MTVELDYRLDGPADAPHLVLLSSIGATTKMWDAQVGALAERFRVVRIDTRGHGRSPAGPPGKPCTLEDLGADALGVLDKLGVERAHVAGLSLGGMTAMWLAAHTPQRVNRLGVLCTSAYLPPRQDWLDRAATVRAVGMGAVAEASVGRWLTAELIRRDPVLAARCREMVAAADPEGYAQCCEAIASMDLRPDLARIAAPTLVIAGDDDPSTPPAHAYAIAEGIVGARVEVLHNAAHVATLEQAGSITRLLLDHFTVSDGERTRREILGDAHVDAAIAATTEFTAPFQEFITRYAWGDVWQRSGLSRRDRSAVTLAVLTALGAEHEIALHVRAALHNGLTRGEIREVLLHAALYAGLPRANRAFAIAQQVLAETTEDADD